MISEGGLKMSFENIAEKLDDLRKRVNYIGECL